MSVGLLPMFSSASAADLNKLAFDPLEYIEHLDQLHFDPRTDAALGE